MILALAKSLQVNAIADGVESVKQKQFLIDIGCHIMQGPLFAHPALAHEFTESMIKTIYAGTQ